MIPNKKRGLTLIELMIVIVINLLVIIVVVNLSVTMNQNYKIATSYLNSCLKGREAIDIMSCDVRMAIRVMDNYSVYISSTNCLVLKVPSVNSDRNILDVNEKFDYCIYRINNGDLWKTVIPGPASSRPATDGPLEKSIKSLNITFNGAPLSDIAHKSVITHVTINISIAETMLGKEYSITPGTTIKLMNYEWEFIR